jgi:hypothetical protein
VCDICSQAYDLLVPTILFFVLGFAPFGIINGMWSQLAVMRNSAPEGMQIGTIVGSVYNVANVFPFLYVFVNKFVKCSDRVVVPTIVLFGVGVAFVLAFFWQTRVCLCVLLLLCVCSLSCLRLDGDCRTSDQCDSVRVLILGWWCWM